MTGMSPPTEPAIEREDAPAASPSGSSGAPPAQSSGHRVPSRALPTRRPGARARAEHRKWKRIEWMWTLIPVGLLLAVAVPSTILLYALDTGPSAFGETSNWDVNVTGQQWFWSFSYTSPYESPGQAIPSNVTAAQMTSALYVPANAVVWLNVTSRDVIHDFNVGAVGVRIDAIPGRINHYWFTIPAGTKPWTEFLIQCTEFCGAGHYSMLSEVIVTPPTCDIPHAGASC
jgi:heme/copper-type cytochrome/quinol oxidase subunit 2